MEPASIISIVSIVITGLFGLWNLKITVGSHRMRKEEFYRDKKKYLQDEYDKRPKLDVVSYKKTWICLEMKLKRFWLFVFKW
jgi:hypothetical protein